MTGGPNEILIPLQSLVSCFLEQMSGSGFTLGTLERLLLSISPKLHSLLSPSTVTQAGGSSVLNLLCTKGQANENREHRSGI